MEFLDISSCWKNTDTLHVVNLLSLCFFFHELLLSFSLVLLTLIFYIVFGVFFPSCCLHFCPIPHLVLSIHMDDQIDGKTLIGSYVCTEQPGEFRWQPGSLIQVGFLFKELLQLNCFDCDMHFLPTCNVLYGFQFH